MARSQDLHRALRLARSRATEWRIAPDRLGVIGFSAGGHLAARAAALSGSPSYSPLDEIDAHGYRPDFTVLVYPAYLDASLASAPGLPPTLLIHSEDDARYVPGSHAYAAALADAAPAAPHRSLFYPTGGHGYGLASRGEARAWPDAATAWLAPLLARPPP